MVGGGSCRTGSQAGMGLNFHIVRSISLFTFSSYGFLLNTYEPTIHVLSVCCNANNVVSY